jgi:hypothetical protein
MPGSFSRLLCLYSVQRRRASERPDISFQKPYSFDQEADRLLDRPQFCAWAIMPAADDGVLQLVHAGHQLDTPLDLDGLGPI